jgi:DNA-binding CsgD family transcriptional regulator
MPPTERRGAALIAIHADILPFRQATAAIDQAGAELPTRTTTSSEYRLETDVCVIGRDQGCQVRVQAHRTDISRRHATIKHEADIYTLYDHSLHGTLVNGRKLIGLCRLDTDDVIGLSNSNEMLRFVDYDHPIQQAIVLTEREQEILPLLAAGRSIKEIADMLIISQNTVSSHLKNLYAKLDVSSRAEAVSQAQKRRLL